MKLCILYVVCWSPNLNLKQISPELLFEKFKFCLLIVNKIFKIYKKINNARICKYMQIQVWFISFIPRSKYILYNNNITIVQGTQCMISHFENRNKTKIVLFSFFFFFFTFCKLVTTSMFCRFALNNKSATNGARIEPLKSNQIKLLF